MNLLCMYFAHRTKLDSGIEGQEQAAPTAPVDRRREANAQIPELHPWAIGVASHIGAGSPPLKSENQDTFIVEADLCTSQRAGMLAVFDGVPPAALNPIDICVCMVHGLQGMGATERSVLSWLRQL